MKRRRSPTSQDVARLAGVSQSTVSYVLTGSRPITPATRARVEDAIATLGYHPNSGARSLRSRHSGVIGLLVPERPRSSGSSGTSDVLMTFLAAITHEARAFGYDILLVTAREGAEGIRRVVGTGICEALLLMEVDRHDERIPALLGAGLPFATIGKPDELPGGSAVDLDFEAVGRMVVECALAERCSSLLLYGGMGRRRQRNDVSRFLIGVEETSAETGLRVVLDDGEIPDVPVHAHELSRTTSGAVSRSTGSTRGTTVDLPGPDARGRTAVFGLGQVPDVLFAAAAAGDLGPGDPGRGPGPLYILMTDDDLTLTSPLLAGLHRIEPRRSDVSSLAVRELVRLLREDAEPRVRLVPPRWAP
jgi:DNA-binding LacI/PurR family transcriptional regulator